VKAKAAAKSVEFGPKFAILHRQLDVKEVCLSKLAQWGGGSQKKRGGLHTLYAQRFLL